MVFQDLAIMSYQASSSTTFCENCGRHFRVSELPLVCIILSGINMIYVRHFTSAFVMTIDCSTCQLARSFGWDSLLCLKREGFFYAAWRHGLH